MKNSLTINFSQETVEILNSEKYTLCCFLACEPANPLSFTPLCWNVTKDFLKSVLIEWEFNLCSYLSTSVIEDNKIIYIAPLEASISKSTAKFKSVAGSTYEIELKQRMLIEDNGKVSIDTQNTLQNVLIQNDSSIAYATGICIYSNTDEQYYGNCVFNTYGNNNIKVAPVNKIFLMFSSEDIQNNTVILKSYNPGILIDLTTSEDNSRTVSYDINTGWNSNNQVWVKPFPTDSSLKSILIS
ncbi:hypothetical protein [Flavobacterium sp. MDT1-60]|uniref:hypothetical protein n=1 Tax=Flavobacterium sp. MDT1-60 TaxID=1979344 RepID=UPI0017846482|nr:hypothetical protein [Flavobacterium sp. MDT1-60]QOG03695.1 hypothetical protein IHE43_05545 [Flavobacterium sp. MDT1-60]